MKSHNSYRIHSTQWFRDSDFEQLCKDLAACGEGYDDLALFSDHTHSVMNLDEMKRRAELFAERAAVLREKKLGDKIGVNILCVMGHHPENEAMRLNDDRFTRLTDLNGIPIDGCFCPSDELYRKEYLAPMFTAWAENGADFIWLDDDLRYFYHFPAKKKSSGEGLLFCFCENCMAKFNRKHGTNYTRDELRKAFSSGSRQARLDIRRKWLNFSGESLCSLLAFTAECVRKVNPAVQVGLMDCELHMYPGGTASYEAMTEAMCPDPAKYPVPRMRPGGSVYTDFHMFPEMVLWKSTRIGACVDYMPERITDIESEIENTNYQRMRKSCRATAFESALYCAAGCTGAAWNIFTYSEPDMNIGIMQYLTKFRPFFDRLADANKRHLQRGLCCLWKPGQAAANSLDGEWDNGFSASASSMLFSEIFGAGLPLAYRPEAADAFILTGNTAHDYTDEELCDIFRRGVYCDTSALAILEERNLAHLAGFRRGRKIAADAFEVFTDHPLNGGSAGFWRDCRLSFAHFWGDGGGVYALEPMNGTCETLAYLEDYRNIRLAGCCMGICTNELGGRVAVAGYYPASDLLFSRKLQQLRAVFNYLSGGMCAWVDSYHRIRIFVRHDTERRKIILELANGSDDPAEDVRIRISSAGKEALLTEMTMKETSLTGTPVSDGVTEFRISGLEPWSVNLLEAEMA